MCSRIFSFRVGRGLKYLPRASGVARKNSLARRAGPRMLSLRACCRHECFLARPSGQHTFSPRFCCGREHFTYIARLTRSRIIPVHAFARLPWQRTLSFSACCGRERSLMHLLWSRILPSDVYEGHGYLPHTPVVAANILPSRDKVTNNFLASAGVANILLARLICVQRSSSRACGDYAHFVLRVCLDRWYFPCVCYYRVGVLPVKRGSSFSDGHCRWRVLLSLTSITAGTSLLYDDHAQLRVCFCMPAMTAPAFFFPRRRPLLFRRSSFSAGHYSWHILFYDGHWHLCVRLDLPIITVARSSFHDGHCRLRVLLSLPAITAGTFLFYDGHFRLRILPFPPAITT